MDNTFARPVITSQAATQHLFGAREKMNEMILGMQNQRMLKNQMDLQNKAELDMQKKQDKQNQQEIALQQIKKIL